MKKLIEISLSIGKVPEITYVSIDEKIEESSTNLAYTLEFHHGGSSTPKTMNIAYRNDGKKIEAA